MEPRTDTAEWVFLLYTLPREPSAPRLSLWRKLRRLGVVQLADGLVALPADARTREQLEWAADDVVAARGTAGVWIARPATRAQERDLARTMTSARSAEYRTVVEQADAARTGTRAERVRALRRLRAENHRIRRRDHFPPPERDHARQALVTLAATLDTPQDPSLETPLDTPAAQPKVTR